MITEAVSYTHLDVYKRQVQAFPHIVVNQVVSEPERLDRNERVSRVAIQIIPVHVDVFYCLGRVIVRAEIDVFLIA